jgi:hypothetical protein
LIYTQSKISILEILGSHGVEYGVVFYDVELCSLIDIDQHFTGAFCLHHHGDNTAMMEAVSSSETSVNIYQSIQRNSPEDYLFFGTNWHN